MAVMGDYHYPKRGNSGGFGARRTIAGVIRSAAGTAWTFVWTTIGAIGSFIPESARPLSGCILGAESNPLTKRAFSGSNGDQAPRGPNGEVAAQTARSAKKHITVVIVNPLPDSMPYMSLLHAERLVRQGRAELVAQDRLRLLHTTVKREVSAELKLRRRTELEYDRIHRRMTIEEIRRIPVVQFERLVTDQTGTVRRIKGRNGPVSVIHPKPRQQ